MVPVQTCRNWRIYLCRSRSSSQPRASLSSVFEFSETELFRAVGLPYSVMFDELDVWLPRVHLECDFHHAAQLDDLLEVSVYVGRLGTKSMHLNFEVRRRGEDLLIAHAHFVLASVKRDTFETVPIPDELRTRLAPYTKVTPGQ